MFWKLLTLAVLIIFAWWRWQQFWHHRRLREQGLPIPERRGWRPISLLALGLILAYGGYLLWFTLLQAIQTFQG